MFSRGIEKQHRAVMGQSLNIQVSAQYFSELKTIKKNRVVNSGKLLT